MKNYVLGFCLSDDLTKVVLIRKNRPEWQKGLLNGVGGKIEEGETPKQAMYREFGEETGVWNNNWVEVLTLKFPYANVEVFALRSSTGLKSATSITDEKVFVCYLDSIEGGIINNVPALIELCILALKDKEGYAP